MISGWPSKATTLPEASLLTVVAVIVVDATETGNETCLVICTGTGTDGRLSVLVENRDLSIVGDDEIVIWYKSFPSRI